MANSQEGTSSQHPDLLAAVVLHTLVNKARDGMTVAAVALACERDPDEPKDVEEIEAALRLLLEDGLAEREGDLLPEPKGPHEPEPTLETEPRPDTANASRATRLPLYRPTRAASRANELSF